METTTTLSCIVNTENESRSNSMYVINNNPNMQDYFRSSLNKEADKRASRLITQNIQSKLVMISKDMDALRAHLNCR